MRQIRMFARRALRHKHAVGQLPADWVTV